MASGDLDSYSREPAFTGRPGGLVEPFATRAEARTFALDVAIGEADVFIGETWDSIVVDRARNPDGTFAPGWVVRIGFVRPGPGDNSGGLLPMGMLAG